jgi:hypothetical protein
MADSILTAAGNRGVGQVDGESVGGCRHRKPVTTNAADKALTAAGSSMSGRRSAVPETSDSDRGRRYSCRGE